MIDLAIYITAFTALFVIIDPVGLTPIFVALTQGMTRPERVRIAVRSCVIAFAILVIFGLLGDNLLEFLGISMSAFRIAGGILLFLTALEMLFELRSKRRQDQADEAPDPSVFPLAIPLIAGPGSITTVILLKDQAAGQPLLLIGFLAVVVLVLAMVMAMFFLAGPTERILGRTGVLVITRVMGMLLAALSIQFILDGFAGLGLTG